MNTIIEQIKAEIEEQIKDPQEYCYGVSSINKLRELLDFIDTLESEKPMQEGLNEEYKDYVESDPVYSKLVNRNAGLSIARHFAQWGAEHLANSNDEVVINGHKVEYDKDKDAITMVAIPNDLEEAAVNWICNHKYLEVLYVKDAFIAGAKWQAEQLLKSSPLPEDTVLFNKGVEEGKRLMMEEAVEGEVVQDLKGVNRVKSFGKIPEWLHFGDKVRIIVCKKED